MYGIWKRQSTIHGNGNLGLAQVFSQVLVESFSYL